MRSYYTYLLITIAFIYSSCKDVNKEQAVVKEDTIAAPSPTAMPVPAVSDTEAITTTEVRAPKNGDQPLVVNTDNVHPNELVSFAETLVGTVYKYASADPKTGFDCSGFITYVFNHFNLQVPRSSIDFTNVGKEVEEANAKRGDIILFTGTHPEERFVGHMGLVTQAAPNLQFIHSSSGKANGVTVTPLNDYYRTRFVKIIRIFKENDL